MAITGTALTYPEIEAEVQNLMAKKQVIQDELEGLKARMGEMTQRSFQTQQASDRFNEMYVQYTADTNKVVENITQIADFLTNMVAMYQDTDAQIAARINI